MSKSGVEPFERAFGRDDTELFEALTRGLRGTRLARWRETYADGIVLEFGELLPKKTPPGTTLPRDRGEWVIHSWGCDVFGQESPGAARTDDFNAVKELLDAIVSQHVANVAISALDLSLVITFEGGAEIHLQTDQRDPELDQWFILTPSGTSIGASSIGTWYLRPSGQSPIEGRESRGSRDAG